MPHRSPTSRRRAVSSTSARDGAGSPDGWLWQKMTAAVPWRISGRKTSRGWISTPGQRSAREAALALHAMAHVEPDRPELLDRQRRQPGAKIRPHFGRARQPLAADRAAGGGAAAELQRRDHQRARARPRCRAYAASSCGVARSRPAVPPTPRSTRRGDVDRARAAGPGPEHDRQQLAVGELLGAARGQPLARPGVRFQGRDRRHPSSHGNRCASSVEPLTDREDDSNECLDIARGVLGWLSTLVVRGFSGPAPASMVGGSRLLRDDPPAIDSFATGARWQWQRGNDEG